MLNSKSQTSKINILEDPNKFAKLGEGRLSWVFISASRLRTLTGSLAGL